MTSSNPPAILHYNGLAIPLKRGDASSIETAMGDAYRGVAKKIIVCEGAWTVLIGPGIPVALEQPAKAPQPTFTGI